MSWHCGVRVSCGVLLHLHLGVVEVKLQQERPHSKGIGTGQRGLVVLLEKDTHVLVLRCCALLLLLALLAAAAAFEGRLVPHRHTPHQD